MPLKRFRTLNTSISFILVALPLAVSTALPARADANEAAVKEVISRWYGELRKGRMGAKSRYWSMLAPGSMIE